MINLPFNKILFDNAPFEIINCVKDENYPNPNEFLEKGYCLFLNDTNVTNNGFNFEKIYFISKEKDELLGNGKLKRGDIVLIIRNNFRFDMGNVAYYGEDTDFKNIRINSNMVILRTKDKLLTQFLYYFLQSNYFKKQIIPYKYIALPVASLPMSLLKNIEFYFPSLIQQKVIVNFISQFDKKINLYKKINKNLEEQLKTIFNSFFLYYDNFSKENLKESEIGLIPNQWNLLSLGEITTEIKEKVGNNTYEIFSGMDTGNLILSKRYYRHHLKNRFKKYLIVKQKEFAYDSFRINIGHIGRNNFDFDGCVDPRYVVFKVEEEYGNFMEMYIKSNRFKQSVNILSLENDRRRLYYDDFSLIKIACPPKELINKFNKIYETYFLVINYNKSVMINLKKIKEVLLPKLISGEIDVSKINL